MSIKIMSVFGTRPEAIKMLPLVKQIAATEDFEGRVCVTAQHREMLDQVMDVFGVRADYDLDLMREGQTLATITSGVLTGLDEVFLSERPDLVLVHGDTTTSFVSALAAFYHQIPVGHVEAGLRTYNMYSPFPEESNRCLTGRLATLHFAPTALNVQNLARENITKNVYQTGNTVIDAFAYTVRDGYNFKNEDLRRIILDSRLDSDIQAGGMTPPLQPERIILLTAHRRENLGMPMRQIFEAVIKIADEHHDVKIIYPVHKNPAVYDVAHEMLGKHPRIHLIDPIDVEDMHNLISRSYLVLTDSGGLQEEAPALGKPVLVLRTETERPEAVEAGVVKVVGVETRDIVDAARLLLDDQENYAAMSRAVNPYGDGHASERICKAIAEWFIKNSPPDASSGASTL